MWYLLNHIYVEVRFTRKVILTFWNQHTNGFVNYTQETSLLQKKKEKKAEFHHSVKKSEEAFMLNFVRSSLRTRHLVRSSKSSEQISSWKANAYLSFMHTFSHLSTAKKDKFLAFLLLPA